MQLGPRSLLPVRKENQINPASCQQTHPLEAVEIDDSSRWIASEIALYRIAQAIRALRSARRTEFGLRISEPAWDMLIELYCRESTGHSTTAALLTSAADVPPSTAARWIEHLTQESFIRTRPHSSDPKTEFIEMTESSIDALERYFAKIQSVAANGPGPIEETQLKEFGP
jgi:DNA-binding MarR family transcriptional regulator